jgi:hypothetical protein
LKTAQLAVSSLEEGWGVGVGVGVKVGVNVRVTLGIGVADIPSRVGILQARTESEIRKIKREVDREVRRMALIIKQVV